VQSGLTRNGALGGAFSGWLAGLAEIRDFYLVALIPAAFTTVAALLLQAKKDASFIIGCALAGAVVSLVLTLLFGHRLNLPIDGRYGYAFVGALTAGVCAFITRR
jgi:hypothetical protein